jgi:hypothetical protein
MDSIGAAAMTWIAGNTFWSSLYIPAKVEAFLYPDKSCLQNQQKYCFAREQIVDTLQKTAKVDAKGDLKWSTIYGVFC